MTFSTSSNDSKKINFILGQPHNDILRISADAIQEMVCSQIKKRDDFFINASLQYGEDFGPSLFNQSLALFLTKRWRLPIAAESLLVTNGASSALSLTVRTLRPKTGETIVWCENPTYFLAIHLFQRMGVIVKSFPMDENGLKVDLIEQSLQSNDVAKPHFVYVIPDHHNPSGVSLSTKRRKKLVALSQKYDFSILSDDPYNFLSFPKCQQDVAQPLSSFIEKQENNEHASSTVFDIGTFSKIIAPGLRVGFIHVNLLHKHLLKTLQTDGVILSGGGLQPFVSCLIEPIFRFENDFCLLDSLIHKIALILQQNCLLLIENLKQNLPSKDEFCKEFSFTANKQPLWSLYPPKGGYFLWFRVGEDVDLVCNALEENNLLLLNGKKCFVSPLNENEEINQNYVRLSFAHLSKPDLLKGSTELCLVLRKLAMSQKWPNAFLSIE